MRRNAHDPQRRSLAACLLLSFLAGCGGAYQPPPPHVAFKDLPVSGSLADAHYAGFTHCYPVEDTLHCRRPSVMFEGQGPFVAALDLAGSDGSGGFSKLTLWHDRDQQALFRLGDQLRQQGWKECLTGEGRRGDKAIYTRAGEHVRMAMELSFAGKRRLWLLPDWDKTQSC